MEKESIKLEKGAARFISLYSPSKSPMPEVPPSFGLSFPASAVKKLSLDSVRLGVEKDEDGNVVQHLVNCRANYRPTIEAWWDGGMFSAEEKREKWLRHAQDLDILAARNRHLDAIFDNFPLWLEIALVEFKTPRAAGSRIILTRVTLGKP